MQEVDKKREHSNLYYILKEDQQAHPMPEDKMHNVRQLLFKKFPKMVPE